MVGASSALHLYGKHIHNFVIFFKCQITEVRDIKGIFELISRKKPDNVMVKNTINSSQNTT